MVDVDQVPYGALYGFQPEYMHGLVHEHAHQESQDESVPFSFWAVLRRVMCAACDV